MSQKYQGAHMLPFPLQKWHPLSEGVLILISTPHAFD